MKNLLKKDETAKCLLNINKVFKLVNHQDILPVPKLMQVNVVHSLGHFSVTKKLKSR